MFCLHCCLTSLQTFSSVAQNALSLPLLFLFVCLFGLVLSSFRLQTRRFPSIATFHLGKTACSSHTLAVKVIRFSRQSQMTIDLDRKMTNT